MKRIEFFISPELADNEHTSRGNQPKWLKNEKWYKQDYMGYEALAEIITSKMLQKSNVTDFIQYEAVMITYEVSRAGCVSQNFIKQNETLIPLNRLHRAFRGTGLNIATSKIPDITERIKYTVDFVEETTKIEDYGKYLTALLEFDAIILNEDRHFNNLAVIRNEKTGIFRPCPIFDNGLALLSDLYTNPLGCDIYNAIDKLEAKPFDRNYIEQVEACEKMYQSQLELYFSKSDVHLWLDELNEYYRDDYLRRAENIIFEQMRKWSGFIH